MKSVEHRVEAINESALSLHDWDVRAQTGSVICEQIAKGRGKDGTWEGELGGWMGGWWLWAEEIVSP